MAEHGGMACLELMMMVIHEWGAKDTRVEDSRKCLCKAEGTAYRTLEPP